MLISRTCALPGRLDACVCFACVCVLCVVFSSSTAISLSAVCPSLKHQLVSEGPLGEKETTGRLHSFFYSHKDVPLLPVLSFFQEVFAVRAFFFTLFHSRSLLADNCLPVKRFLVVVVLFFSQLKTVLIEFHQDFFFFFFEGT